MVKDTYTFLINYLLLCQLRHAAELLLLLPVRARLRRLSSGVVLITTSRLSTTTVAEAAVAPAVILPAEAGASRWLLLLEVGQSGEDVLWRGARIVAVLSIWP